MADEKPKRYIIREFKTLAEYEDALNDYSPEGPLKPDRIGTLEFFEKQRVFQVVARFELATKDDPGYARLDEQRHQQEQERLDNAANDLLRLERDRTPTAEADAPTF